MNGHVLEEVASFTYLGSKLTTDGRSIKEVKRRISLATSAMTRLSVIWKSKSITFPVKWILYNSLVVSILLYGCESWTFTVDLERKVDVFGHKGSGNF